MGPAPGHQHLRSSSDHRPAGQGRLGGSRPWAAGLSSSEPTPYRARVTSVPLHHDQSLPADWRDLLALTKPRVMSLVVFTGLCGLLAAPVPVHPVLGFAAVLCIALGAGAAGALNQWYEADLDAKMKRTAKRPLPAGRMSRQTALHFGVGPRRLFGHPDGPGRQPSRRRDAGRFDPVLRAGLHRLAEAADRAEHRHRRRGRGLSAADRLGGGDRRRHDAADPAVRDHLPVDPAAFLGAVAVRPDRLCQCRRADAAGGGGRSKARAARSCFTRCR